MAKQNKPKTPRRSRRNSKKKEDEGIVIHFDGMEKVMSILTKCQISFYDPEENLYFADGIKFRADFFEETIAKFSHYINVVANFRKDIDQGNLSDYIESQKEMKKSKIERLKKREEARQKTLENDGPMLDKEGNSITYDN